MEKITHVAVEYQGDIYLSDNHGKLLRIVKDFNIGEGCTFGYYTNNHNFVTGKQALRLPTPNHIKINKSFMRI